MKRINYYRRGRWAAALAIIGLALGIFFLYYCVMNTFPNSGFLSYVCGGGGFLAWVGLGSKWERQIKEDYKAKQEEHDKQYWEYTKNG